MKSVKQELVYVETANCALDGCIIYIYTTKLKGRKYFTEKGTNCTPRNRQGKITVATYGMKTN